MRLKFFKIFLIFFSSIINTQEEANRIITFFILEFPEKINFEGLKIDKQQAREFCNIIPDFSMNCSSLDLPINFGIFATYAGYLDITNETGQIIFPRSTQKDSFTLLITPKIKPIFMLKNTIAYWEIVDPETAKMYMIEKKQDIETKLFYFDVQEKKIPKKNRVPIHCITIIANPENIDVPIGITPTRSTTQIILPNIYAKQSIKYVRNALFMITLKPFFRSIKKIFKERPLGYAEHIMQ